MVAQIKIRHKYVDSKLHDLISLSLTTTTTTKHVILETHNVNVSNKFNKQLFVGSPEFKLASKCRKSVAKNMSLIFFSELQRQICTSNLCDLYHKYLGTFGRTWALRLQRSGFNFKLSFLCYVTWKNHSALRFSFLICQPRTTKISTSYGIITDEKMHIKLSQDKSILVVNNH